MQETGYSKAEVKAGDVPDEVAMVSKLNFEQPVHKAHRDMGGPSSLTVLMLAIGTVFLWAVLIHMAPG